MKVFIIGVGAVILAVAIALASGVRVLVIKPIGAIPDGRTLIVSGLPGFNYIDSPDAFCQRTMGNVTLICRSMGLGKIANDGRILARLPYSSTLDIMAGTPETTR